MMVMGETGTINYFSTLLLLVTILRFYLSFYIFCRYAITTRTFTVPPGGDGYYYLSTYLLGINGENSHFDIQMNGKILCTVRLEQFETAGDLLQSACGAAIYTAQGTLGCFKFADFLSIIFHGFKISLLFDFSSPSGDTV